MRTVCLISSIAYHVIQETQAIRKRMLVSKWTADCKS